MISQHYDEDALVALLDTPGGEADVHLVECGDCRRSFEEYRAVTSCLGEDAVWDLRVLKEDPVPSTIQNLRAFADRMHAEDAAALPLVAELLAGPRDQWMPRLMSDPKYRTAGVVRKLMEASDKAIDVMPPDALEISALATEIADHLDPAAYPSDTVMKLRGNAWRDRGFCLYQNSRFADALEAITNAELVSVQLTVSDFEAARVRIAKSLLFRTFENFLDSAHGAQLSGAIFARFGQTTRRVGAAIAEAQALWKRGQISLAIDCLLPYAAMSQDLDDDTAARIFANLVVFYRDAGDADQALHYAQLAEQTKIGDVNDAATPLRIQWSVGVLFGRSGKIREAEKRLLPLIASFERLGMTSEAVQVGLELAEFYLAEGRTSDVAMLCRRAIDFYVCAGLPSTERAMTALAFLNECLCANRLTAASVRHVREYLVRLPTEPALLFMPPPNSPF